jgi:ubiquinone/menaquinone biosynthesis C-methylase UbiE
MTLSTSHAEQHATFRLNDIHCLECADAVVQALPFPDASFDIVIATCVFCSVPDLVLCLRELRRVLVSGGQVLLLEHVLSHRPLLGPLMGTLNPLVVRRMGANINRETVENVRRAGFTDLQVEDLWLTSSSGSRRGLLAWLRRPERIAVH